MYENIGKTIQSVGCILGWLLSIAGGIAWLYFLGNDEAVTGWICFAVGLRGSFPHSSTMLSANSWTMSIPFASRLKTQSKADPICYAPNE